MKKSSENRLLSANGTFFVRDGARRGLACGASHPIANPPSRRISGVAAVKKEPHSRVDPRPARPTTSMKPYMARCPGESQDPSTRRSCRRDMDPGFRRGSVQYSRSSRTGLFLVKLFLLPGENRRDGIVPDRSDDDAGKAGEPPDLVLGKDIAGDADIGDRTEGANRIKSEKPPQ
jgi:hypothetical protein